MSKPTSKPKTEVIGVDIAEPGSDYTVVTPIDKAGDVYQPGRTIVLTAAEAEYPLAIGAIKPKAAE